MPIRRPAHLLALALTVTAAGCLDEVPVEGEHLTEEQLAGDDQPEMDGGDELLIESGIGVSGTLTLWDDHDYNDTRQFRYSYDSSFGNDGFNDKASSLSNRTDQYWMLYADRDYGGVRVCVRPHSRVSDLKDVHFTEVFVLDWNDRISSVKKLTTSSSSCGDAKIVGVQ